MCRPAVYEASSLREADDARRRDAQVEVDLVVCRLDGQARDEGDRAWPRVGGGAGGRGRGGVRVRVEFGFGLGFGFGFGFGFRSGSQGWVRMRGEGR